ncbi:MAG: TlpA disulfide reductase family protein [Mucilaginibacter sp.]
MKKVFISIVVSLLALAASAQQFEIRANITGFSNGTKFYLTDPELNTNIDSTIIQNDHFVIKGHLDDVPKSLWVTRQDGRHYYYFTLLIGNETVDVKGDIKDMPYSMTITGSKTQNEHNLLLSQTGPLQKKRNELVEQSFALTGDSAKIKSKAIWKAISKLDSETYVIQKKFVVKNLNTYEGLDNLFFMRGAFKDSLQQMYNSLKPEFKQSNFGQRIATYLKVGDQLKQRDQFVDFEAMDQNGKKHHLSDFKGKYILLDFSETYCGPCIQSVPDMQNIVKKHSDKMTVITFSGDGSKDMWQLGVKRDKPTWLSLWDGKGIYGATPLKYGVTGFPDFIVIDPNGKIISNWMGYGKNDDGRGSLETNVDKLLANGK